VVPSGAVVPGLPPPLTRVVVVRDPAGVQPDDFFVTSQLAGAPAEVAAGYAGRWSIEVTNRDAKQALGGEDPQSWKGDGPARAAALSLWLHTAVWCWYLATNTGTTSWRPRPWYTRKRTPSFADALAALRRTLWQQRIAVMSACARLPAEILDPLLDTLAEAA